jgi:hypothetical protein
MDISWKGMDEMDPQMSSVLAARVAFERLATVDHEQLATSRRPFGSLARLARANVALVTRLVWLRRSPARARGCGPTQAATR